MKRNNINRLWLYEQEAAQALVPDEITKGRLDLPTGGGKSVICRELVNIKFLAANNPLVVVVFTPRLFLNKQWINDCNDYLNKKHRLGFNFINVSSDNIGDLGLRIERDLYNIKGPGVIPVLSTVRSEEVKHRINRLVRDGFGVIVVATYHSNHVILKSEIEFDLAIYDECQFLPTGKSELLTPDDKDFFEATKIKSRKKIYTTATPKYTPSDRGKGMNNMEVYGPVIYSKSPKELIDIGAIVKPCLHLVGISPEISGTLNVEEDIVVPSAKKMNEKAYNAHADMAYNSFLSHNEIIRSNSVSPDKIGAKLLVVCRGSGHMRGVLSSRRFKELRELHPNIKIYALCADWGIEFDGNHYKQVTNRSKEEFLESVWNLDAKDQAIIFHVDMIGVGLDVPMITGVMFFRCCDKTKFQQNIGRGGRLHPGDRIRIENGELEVGDYKNYIKPQYYVIIPFCFEDREDFYKQYRDWLVSLRSDYGWDSSSTIFTSMGQPAPVDVSENAENLEIQMRSIKEDIETFYHCIEHDEFFDEQEMFIEEFRRQLNAGSDEILTNLSMD